MVELLLLLAGCQDARRAAVGVLDRGYTPEIASEVLEPIWSGRDLERDRAAVALTAVVEGLEQPTDFTFVDDDLLLITEKTGRLRWVSPADGGSGTLLTLPVVTVSEQGLLGLALHPRFAENGRIFLNYTLKSDGAEVSRVESWVASEPGDLRAATLSREGTILEVAQPYQNHNAGPLVFGPDGYLYVGWGDGGFRFDPHGHGQDWSTLLGAMLRLDVDGAAPYAVPPDNPLVGVAGARPEIWAWGLRNPWKYSFEPGGLVVADVGQDRYEELSYCGRGDNLGWNIREGRACFRPEEGCPEAGLVEPFYVYERIDGQSITGGRTYTGERLPALAGRYLFGDFVSGRIWALTLPGSGSPARAPLTLGKWPVLIAAFARDGAGEIYIAAYGRGAIYRLDPVP